MVALLNNYIVYKMDETSDRSNGRGVESKRLFGHFRAFFAVQRNVHKFFAIIGVIIFVIIMNKLGLYEGFKPLHILNADPSGRHL